MPFLVQPVRDLQSFGVPTQFLMSTTRRNNNCRSRRFFCWRQMYLNRRIMHIFDGVVFARFRNCGSKNLFLIAAFERRRASRIKKDHIR